MTIEKIKSKIHPIAFLRQAESMVLGSGGVRTTFDNASPLSGSAQFFCVGGAVVQPHVTFDGVILLGEGVTIGPYSMLRGPLYIGPGSRIGPYSEITRCIIGENCTIAHKNIIPDTVIGDNVWVAGGVIVCNTRLDLRSVMVEWGDEVETAPKFGAVLDEGCVLGVNVTAMPGTWVHAGVIVIGPSVIRGHVRDSISKGIVDNPQS